MGRPGLFEGGRNISLKREFSDGPLFGAERRLGRDSEARRFRFTEVRTSRFFVTGTSSPERVKPLIERGVALVLLARFFS